MDLASQGELGLHSQTVVIATTIRFFKTLTPSFHKNPQRTSHFRTTVMKRRL